MGKGTVAFGVGYLWIDETLARVRLKLILMEPYPTQALAV